MITRLVALRVPPDRQAQLAEVLASSAPRVRAVAGCQGLTIVQDISDP